MRTSPPGRCRRPERICVPVSSQMSGSNVEASARGHGKSVRLGLCGITVAPNPSGAECRAAIPRRRFAASREQPLAPNEVEQARRECRVVNRVGGIACAITGPVTRSPGAGHRESAHFSARVMRLISLSIVLTETIMTHQRGHRRRREARRAPELEGQSPKSKKCPGGTGPAAKVAVHELGRPHRGLACRPRLRLHLVKLAALPDERLSNRGAPRIRAISGKAARQFLSAVSCLSTGRTSRKRADDNVGREGGSGVPAKVMAPTAYVHETLAGPRPCGSRTPRPHAWKPPPRARCYHGAYPATS